MSAGIGLVLNPTAGHGRGARARDGVLAALRATGRPVVDLSGPDLATAAVRARSGLGPGLAALVVVGGDGMAHLGVNVVAGTGVPLGIVALGSGNDVARELGLPVHDPAASVALISRALDAAPGHVTRAVDAVAVGPPGQAPARWYLGVLSAGIDAAVNDRANRLRWPRGGGRYVRGLLAELARYAPYGYRVTMDGTAWEGPGTLVAVANLASFGGGMRVVPGAVPDDGVLDVLIADGVSRTTLLRLFPRVYAGAHLSHPAVHVHRARRVLIEAAPAHGATPPVTFADGERVGALPLECVVHPDAVRVLARTLGA
ncbi:diacylglycerol/lipid kinase family protein [Georgenia wangjunii]|uniref:diacylglycerol/lipid kinase family protein n=1 Tax=Georgenia wangjunii TaxID=3117730 RepID=UPI002F261064